jgi:peptidoglycan hydrolase CwlO-like protein
MLYKSSIVALFAIAIASSIITLNAGLGGSASAATARKVTLQNQDNAYKTLLNDKSNFQSQIADAGDSIGPTGKVSGISAKDLKNL